MCIRDRNEQNLVYTNFFIHQIKRQHDHAKGKQIVYNLIQNIGLYRQLVVTQSNLCS